MVDYEGAIRRPFSDLGKLVIASLINILPLANLIAKGYLAGCAQATFKKKKKLPELDDIAGLFIKGLIVLVIEASYALAVAACVWAAIVAFLGLGLAPPLGEVSVLSVVLGVGAFILLVLIALFAAYIKPLAVMRYLKSGDIADAFALRRILRMSLTKQYALAWIVVSIYTMAAIFAGLMLFFVGVIFTTYAASITAYSIFAEVYEEIER